MLQIEDLTLVQFLGKGAYGEVYLSTMKGKNKYFATKKIKKEIADRPSFKKYFINEIDLLKQCNHPNIVKLEGIKESQNHYYLIMEYMNGRALSDCLKIYMERYKKAFPEEIVQYLMNQIIDGLNYLHKQKIIHRDLKLDNIMVNFDSDQDRQNLNMLKAKIKIIDFDFATKLSTDKNNLAFTAIGTYNYMDPIILNKFAKIKNKNLGYDQKADIWSIGNVCYELLIGKPAFDAESLGELINKVESGNYPVPNFVSKEIVSFINSMLQYDSKSRLSAEELKHHPFLTKNVSQFTKMDTVRAKKSESLKKSNTIWSIFNQEEKYINIKVSMSKIPEKSIKPKKEQEVNCSNSYTDNQLGYYFNNNTYTDNQLGINNPKNNPNINFVNNNNLMNMQRSRTQQETPAFNNKANPFYAKNIHPISQISQISQSGQAMSQMKNFQSQQQKMMHNPSFGIPKNNIGSYQQNIAAQGNFHKALTFKENSNYIFKGLK